MMKNSTIVGLIGGIVALLVGMTLKGVGVGALLNPAALLIIFGGTAAAVTIAFPMEEVTRFPKLMKVLFGTQNLASKKELMELFMKWSAISRREGLLALESNIETVDDPFLKNGIKMIIDGHDHEFVRDVLMEEVTMIEDRHKANALIFTQAGTYAPTLGVLGAVVGLVAALGNMNDIDALGHSIAAAFIATLFGIFVGYVLAHPFANKLKRMSKREAEIKILMIEGLLSIQSGISTMAIEQKLSVFLSNTEKAEKNAQKPTGDD